MPDTLLQDLAVARYVSIGCPVIDEAAIALSPCHCEARQLLLHGFNALRETAQDRGHEPSLSTGSKNEHQHSGDILVQVFGIWDDKATAINQRVDQKSPAKEMSEVEGLYQQVTVFVGFKKCSQFENTPEPLTQGFIPKYHQLLGVLEAGT